MLLHMRMANTWGPMRPVSTDSDGPAPPENLSCPYPLVGPLPASEMSLLQSLGPVQSWLGQELEKCGIDAMIYTRYVLSLLLHDSYDYDLQDQVRSHNFKEIILVKSKSLWNYCLSLFVLCIAKLMGSEFYSGGDVCVGNIMASLEQDINLPGEVNNGAFLSCHGTCTTD